MAPRRRRSAPRLVTLSSDLGAAYAAQMKAVFARSIDPGRVVDLVHELPPHAVAEAAFVVRAIARGFPRARSTSSWSIPEAEETGRRS